MKVTNHWLHESSNGDYNRLAVARFGRLANGHRTALDTAHRHRVPWTTASDSTMVYGGQWW